MITDIVMKYPNGQDMELQTQGGVRQNWGLHPVSYGKSLMTFN